MHVSSVVELRVCNIVWLYDQQLTACAALGDGQASGIAWRCMNSVQAGT